MTAWNEPSGHINLTVFVAAPTSDGAIGAQTARMVPQATEESATGGDGFESTVRSGGLARSRGLPNK